MTTTPNLGVFPPTAEPRVFGLPPGADFLRCLVAGLDDRLASHPPEAMARVTIWVNSRRAERGLRDALSGGSARLLPRLHVISDLSRDPVHASGLPELIPSLRRKLDLARLVGALISAQPGLAADTAAFDLADSLSELLDELGAAGLAPEIFETVDPGEHALHWQRSLRFLGILKEVGEHLASGDGQARLRAVTLKLEEAWSSCAPREPLLVAGSTGSRAGTRAFMRLVARQPQGALILPGFDFDLPESVWQRLQRGEETHGDHPQGALAQLLHELGITPSSVHSWNEGDIPSRERNNLISLALRPAPVTDQWRSEGGRLKPTLEAACEGLTWIDAPDPRSEARVVAYALRRAAEDNTRAALITPDRSLARRVGSELDRWRLIPDDSAGRPLALTPPGVFLRLVADGIHGPLSAEALLSLLKHPLVCSVTGGRRRHMDLVIRLETSCLRGGAPHADWDGFAKWSEDLAAKSAEHSDAPTWVAWLKNCLHPMEFLPEAPLGEFAIIHRRTAEALAGGPEMSEAHGLWQKDAGQACLSLVEEIAQETTEYGVVKPSEYRALLASQMSRQDVPEEAVVTDESISIWGTLEARVQSADLVILGGLNEGIWPSQPGADPWLSRTIRREIGLALPDSQIGLAAHDFQQAIGAKEVILVRAARDAEAPTVPSRWLLRIENLLRGLGDTGSRAIDAAKARGNTLLSEASRIDLPAASITPARRPCPRPPLGARPSELSVTQLESLVRDPYAIYARKVLNLKQLDPPGCSPDALSRGSAIHAALQSFVERTQDELPRDALEIFLACAEDALSEAAPWPAIRAIWKARFAKFAKWFIEEEARRREFAEPAALEIRGKRKLKGTPLPFTVTAKADRIDIHPNGGCAIYDYKSGSIPSQKQIATFHLAIALGRRNCINRRF